jgi:hypothetical protein
MFAGGLLLAAGLIAVAPSVAGALTTVYLYVDGTAGTATTGCTSPGAGACMTISEGAAAADALSDSAVTVFVAAGTYHEHYITLDVPTTDSVTLQGASAASTEIDAQAMGYAIGVTTLPEAAGTSAIDGFTIYDGSANGVNIANPSDVTLLDDTFTSDSSGNGGAVYENQGTVTLNDDTFFDDSSSIDGGAVYAFYGTATLEDDSFIDDSATSFGGGVYNDESTVSLENDTFSGDEAVNGGGIYTFGGTEITTIDNDTISGNTATGAGGGLYDAGGVTDNLNDDTFSGNTAASTSGGGISNNDGIVNLANSVLAANGPGGDCSGYSEFSPNPVTDDNYNVADDDTCALGANSISGSATIGTLSLAANGSAGPETAAITSSSSAFMEVPAGACTIASDERGLPRPGAGSECDAGAFELQGIEQTISFVGPGTGTVGGMATLSATGGASGNPVVFSLDVSSAPGVCHVSGDTVSYTGVGSCVIDANQAGDSSYANAPKVTQNVTVGPGSQAVAFTTAAPTNALVGGATYAPAATGGASGNPVVFSIDPASTPGACSISAGVVSFTGAGTCVIDANQAANANYFAAPQVTQNVLVGAAPSGYDLVGHDGGVFVFPTGQAGGFYGSLPGLGVQVTNIVGMVPTANDAGYFLVGSDGGVFAFGNAPFENSLPGIGVHVSNIVGIVPTSNDQGYFLVGSDGGVFTFGNAPFLGSLPSIGVNVTNIIGIAANPSDTGYWLVAANGTVYSFGTATNFGSVTGTSSPVCAIESTPDGGGYWIVAQNGAVYTFGDAGAFGNLPALGVSPAHPIIGLVPTSDDSGYWLIGSDGGIFAFGDAPFVGSLPGLGVSVTDIVGAVPTHP